MPVLPPSASPTRPAARRRAADASPTPARRHRRRPSAAQLLASGVVGGLVGGLAALGAAPWLAGLAPPAWRPAASGTRGFASLADCARAHGRCMPGEDTFHVGDLATAATGINTSLLPRSLDRVLGLTHRMTGYDLSHRQSPATVLRRGYLRDAGKRLQRELPWLYEVEWPREARQACADTDGNLPGWRRTSTDGCEQRIDAWLAATAARHLGGEAHVWVRLPDAAPEAPAAGQA